MTLRLTVCIFCMLAIASCKQKAATVAEKPETFPVVALQAKDTLLQKDYVTSIAAVRKVEIRSKVNGFLEKVLVDEGKQVVAGQVLFLLNSAPYKVQLEKALAAVKSAEAEAISARVEVSRVKLLVEKNVISKTELQLAEAKLEVAMAKIRQAKAEEADARLHLEYTVIRSPFTGTIDRLPLKLGSLVEEGTLLTTVADAGSVYAYFNLSENEYLQYARRRSDDSSYHGNEVQLMLSDGSAFSSKGAIETMEGEFDQSTGSIAFRARFGNNGGVLKHGSTGKVVLTSWVEDALLVPQKSVFEIQDKNYVYLVSNEGKVSMRNFAIKARVGAFYLVDNGLKAGDRIVYEGLQTVKEGSTIAVQMVQNSELQSLAARSK